jgi:hypothetical protein
MPFLSAYEHEKIELSYETCVCNFEPNISPSEHIDVHFSHLIVSVGIAQYELED